MKIIQPSANIEEIMPNNPLEAIERAGRTCYKSEDHTTTNSAKTFVKMLLNKSHTSVLEHSAMTVRFIIDRGVSHELVRHRITSPSQESTRYCNYSTNRFGNEITVILPCFWRKNWNNPTLCCNEFLEWKKSCEHAEKAYFELLQLGASPQEARTVLPNSLKTEVVLTANLREWRTIFTQRTSPSAHPQMREVMVPLLGEVKLKIPVVFDDIGEQPL
jgi:thymidylate synthase (FAD)